MVTLVPTDCAVLLRAGPRLPAGCVANRGDAGPAGDAGGGHAAHRRRDDQAGSRCACRVIGPAVWSTVRVFSAAHEAARFSALADGTR